MLAVISRVRVAEKEGRDCRGGGLEWWLVLKSGILGVADGRQAMVTIKMMTTGRTCS